MNYPERRIAGIARVIARAANGGLTQMLDDIWKQDLATQKKVVDFCLQFDVRSSDPT